MCGALGIYRDSGSSDPKAVRARVREEPHWLPRTAAHLNLHALGGVGGDPMHTSCIFRRGAFPHGQGSHLPGLKRNTPTLAFPGPA